MAITIGVPRETAPEERRVAVVPEVVKKLKALGVNVCIERGAGSGGVCGARVGRALNRVLLPIRHGPVDVLS